ncbi:hypothetical protein Tco_1536252 [Tanacetum coccineum]
MSIFKVPMGVLNKLESIRQNLFNGVDGLDKKITWIGWDKVLASKKNDGLGVSSFFASNRALLFKWVWHFFTQESSWWTCFIKSFHDNQGALDTCKLSSRRSPWLKIIQDLHSLTSKGDDALKSFYPRLFVLDACKSISVAEKLRHPTLVHSFRRLLKGGVEEEQHDLLRSRIVDVI